MSAHDRFESLAGAVALGEATAQERTDFDEHAATCARCRDDAGDAAFVVEQIASAHRSETWRPSQPIVERLRDRRSNRSRRTLGVLGWAVGASLVLNVALATGIGARIGGAFSPVAQPPADVVASRITLEAPAIAILAPHVWHRPHVAHPSVRKAHVARVAPKSVIATVPKHPKIAPLPTLEDMPDVLVGLDLYGDGTRHAVAVDSLPRCASHRDDVEDLRPCREPTGRVLH